MNKLFLAAAAASSLLLCGIASAEDVPATPPAAAFPLRAGGTLKSADGHRLGFIDQVVTGKDGQPVAVQVILDSRIVTIPASTIQAVDRTHFTTTLSYKDVEHL